MLGILGGMGPLATVEFMRKLILRSSESGERGCLPMLAVIDGRIPDRSAAILAPEERASPLPDMIRCMRLIEAPDVEVIVIPCNSAHYWLRDLQTSTHKPIISMIDTAARHTCSLLSRRVPPWRCGVLGTRGLLASDLYQDRLGQLVDVECQQISEDGQSLVDDIIINVKHGQIDIAKQNAEALVRVLASTGIEVWILACTELPVAFACVEVPEALTLIDPTDVLVDAAIAALHRSAATVPVV